ncbi:MAG TPA: two-component regulator propeller domain-containing protein [Saprospiraceae bacterium]|nr:two-component regulator propeller domain-containing protein [Saprospiraceae bacterium]
MMKLVSGKRTIKWLILGLMLLPGIRIIAQSESRLHYEIKRIGMREGMEFQYVTALCKDKEGLLWIGTKRGLYFFDGIRLERFDLKNVPGREIVDAYINCLDADQFDRHYLFVSTPRGVLLVDTKAKKICSDTLLGLPTNFLGTFNYFKKIKSGQYWCVKERKIYMLNLWGNGKHDITLVNSTPFYLPIITDLVLAPDTPEGAWIIIENHLIKLNQKKLEFYTIPEKNNDHHDFQPSLLYWGMHNGQWYGWDQNKGCYIWNEYLKRIELAPKSLTPSSLLHEVTFVNEFLGMECELKCFLPLPAGQIAIGTNHGLFIVRKRPVGFVVHPGLKGKEIRGIHVDTSNYIYVGTYEGLFVCKKDDPTYCKKYNETFVWDFLPLDTANWLLTHESKEILTVWNPKTRKSGTQKPLFRETSNGLSVSKDSRGVLWVGGYHGMWYTPDPNKLEFVHWEFNSSGFIPYLNFVRIIIPDPNGNGILFGNSSGIYRLYYDSISQKYIPDKRFPNLLESPVSDIYIDQYNQTWVATKGSGLACIKSHNGQYSLEWFNTNIGLSNNSVCMIIPSNQDSVLWLSTHNGLSRYNTFTNKFYNFYEDNGLPNNEFNTAAAAKGPDGTIYFGGLAGLVYFNPNDLDIKDYSHEAFVSNVRYFNQETQKISQLQMEVGKDIYLPPYPEYLELQLASTEFINPSKMRFRYRLIGLSDLWTNTSGENELKFIRLDPGAYTFELQVLSEDGQRGRIMQLPIIVAKPYYETTWFRAFLALALFGFLYLIYRTRMNRLLYKQSVGQQIADDLHDDIGNKLNLIHLKAQNLAKYQTDNPETSLELNKLMDISRNALRSLQNMIWSVDAKKEELSSLLLRMQDFADSFLRPMGTKVKFNLPAVVPTKNMNLHVRYHVLLIYQEILTNMVKFTQPVLVEVSITLEKNTLRLIIKNTYSHVYKHEKDLFSIEKRGKTTIERRINRVKGQYFWKIQDENTQIVELAIPHVFKRK